MSACLRSRCCALVAVAITSACLFAPNVSPHGYTPCSSDAECDAPRFCSEALCAPPPWRDEEFATRRALVVENTSDRAIEKGTAIPAAFGGDTGLVALADLGADFRFSDFDRAANAWVDVAVFLDREDDRFTAWIPLQRELAPGRKTTLAWIESNTFDGLPQVREDPGTVFVVFDTFDAPLDDAWFAQGTPDVDDGFINVADNEAIVLREPLTQPVFVQALARLNGNACDEVFIGVIGDDDAIFEVPPSAGVFVNQDRSASVSLAPTADSVPSPVGDPFVASNAFARYAFAIDGGAVRVAIDGAVVFEDIDLRPAFADEPLFFAVQVGGACSVDVDAVWAAALPQPLPTVVAEPAVNFNLALDG